VPLLLSRDLLEKLRCRPSLLAGNTDRKDRYIENIVSECRDVKGERIMNLVNRLVITAALCFTSPMLNAETAKAEFSITEISSALDQNTQASQEATVESKQL
jgi:hypothetical protein